MSVAVASAAVPGIAPPLIELRGVEKRYRIGRIEVAALQGIDLLLPRGQMLAIVGPSGSGKSTLMNLIGCLDRPTAGSYRLAGEEVAGMGDDALASIRNRRIGFIFQSFHLLPLLTAQENVELPLVYRGVRPRERRERAERALAAVGLADRRRHRPAELSGGQQQRVAIARALAGEPDLLLADEPTGALDSRSGAEVLQLFHELHGRGLSLIVVTHDPQVAAQCERIVRLRDGRIEADEPVPAGRGLPGEGRS